jgi:CHAD domain-containing protein
MSDEPALRPDLAVGEALRAVARDILVEARGAISDPALSDAEAVHRFRREIKRWRALLRLLDPYLGDHGRRLRTEARDLARSLGGARDAQSALDALNDLAEHGLGFSDRSLATVRKRIAEIKQAAETTTLTSDMRTRIVDALDQATAAAERWPLHTLTFADIADRLARGYRAGRRLIPESWPEADAEALHELRKRIVSHRYQMETVRPLWRRFTKMWLGEAQRLRDRLGRHQDLLLLELLIAPHQPLAAWRSRLAPAIARRKDEHVEAARRIATRMFVEKPGAFRRRLEVMWETGD